MSVMDIVLLIIGLTVLLITIAFGFCFGIKGLRGKDLTSKSDKKIFTKKALEKYSKFLSYYYLAMSLVSLLVVVSFFTKLMVMVWISVVAILMSNLCLIAFMFYINFAKGYRKKK